ncbi:PREDICTED: uncharacterized protein LOC104709478 [Camelina sativa]|uniref:Uncharacterized protein LOC104709478 n=1 Tax=Camelina sativa TaxID=90675 RepID=A0ABM0TCV9_CAMSA|nr:PREDICTED: uncharacterized protein LOC104709478 [Camelina sativa]
MEAHKFLWQEIKDHHDSPLIQNKHMGKHFHVDVHPMRDFQTVVNLCSLSDVASHVLLFTWCYKRENDLILKKLDRVMANSAWKRSNPHAYIVFNVGGCSDHLNFRIMVKGAQFNFVNLLTKMEEYLPIVGSYWQDTQPLFLSTSSLFRFSKKRKGLESALRSLENHHLGNLVWKSKEAFDSLCKKQHANLANPSPQPMEVENTAFKQWEFLACLEEKYLKQKSKLHWLQVGDRNNKAFPRAATMRAAMNSVKEIQCQDKRVVVKEDEIKVESER